MDNIAATSLDWALRHVVRFGDTDIFPVPFELNATGTAWNWLRDELQARNLDSYSLGPFRRFLVPKPRGGFRPATQLDPLDTIIYAALIYEAAPRIEAVRIPTDRRIACSYRLEITADGKLFRDDNGWPDFQARSWELAGSDLYTHVVVADISDFYNSIYHHRLENALAAAGIEDPRRKNIIHFINQLTATQSSGIPVGPTASIVLAEACMTDVDSMLLIKGYPHTRYVDDFRIFCKSKREAVRALHDLSEYLYTAHRQALEPGKSRILPLDEFIGRELPDPEEMDREATNAALAALWAELVHTGPYSSEEEEPPSEEVLTQATRDALTNLFLECVTTHPLQLGLARYLLRKAARLRTHVLVELVFDNLETLAPVLRDVARYLRASMRREFSQRHFESMKQFLTDSASADLPFVHLWGIELLRTVPALRAASESLALAERYQSSIGVRPAAQMADQLRVPEWVRARKETWRSHAEWDRRALIWAAHVLPPDERNHWLDYVQGVSAGLDRVVAQATRTRP